jgi:hypothetical protein
METMSDALDFNDDLDCFTIQMGAREILASKYQLVETETTAQQQKHLSQRQRDELAGVLRQSTLFSGKLASYPKQKVHLEGNEKIKPLHYRPSPVPHAHLSFKFRENYND